MHPGSTSSLRENHANSATGHMGDSTYCECEGEYFSANSHSHLHSCSKDHMLSWRYACAVAAARVVTPSLRKMLLTCRSTVRSLMTSRAAMSRFVTPEATSRSTSSSRRDSE